MDISRTPDPMTPHEGQLARVQAKLDHVATLKDQHTCKGHGRKFLKYARLEIWLGCIKDHRMFSRMRKAHGMKRRERLEK